MAKSMLQILLLLPLVVFASQAHNSPASAQSYLLSPHTFSPNHQKMLNSFKIYIYPHQDTPFTNSVESAFYTKLLASPFLTTDPREAHLFFLPFSSISSRHIKHIRYTYPYWNQTLGADHFYLHCSGLGYQSDRNLVELKKNAVQISCFPAGSGKFVPHKDITLPPLMSKFTNFSSSSFNSNRYCLMRYDDGSVGKIGEALREGCVPVVVVRSDDGGGMVQDLPMMGVVRWVEMAVFVGGLSEEEVWRKVREVESGDGAVYKRMRGLGVAAARHFTWGGGDQYDAFHSVLYQLWVRRHIIRYARVAISSN